MTTESYKIKTENYTFSLTISKNLGTHTISIGGEKQGCVNVSVSTPDSIAVQRGFHKINIATIPILEWNSECALDKSLLKGAGTIHMIKTILSEVKKRYPYVELFTLTDNSHVKCTNGKEIPLLVLSLIEYKMSWYEKHFNARITDTNLHEKYTKGKEMLNDPYIKIPFDNFRKSIEPYTNKGNIESLEKYYQSETYYDFFGNILKDKGKFDTCNHIVDWIDIFIAELFRMNPNNVEWAISNKYIEEIPVEITISKNIFTHNGGYTRKNIKYGRVNISEDLR